MSGWWVFCFLWEDETHFLLFGNQQVKLCVVTWTKSRVGLVKSCCTLIWCFSCTTADIFLFFSNCFWFCIVKRVHVHREDLVPPRGNGCGILNWSPVLKAPAAAGAGFVCTRLCFHTGEVETRLLPACSLLVQRLAGGTCQPSAWVKKLWALCKEWRENPGLGEIL